MIDMGRAAAPHRESHRHGHTLWELLFALTLLAMAAAVVAPTVIERRAPAEDDATRVSDEIVSLLSRARLTALERGTDVEVVLDPIGGDAWLLAREAGTPRLLGTRVLTRTANLDLVAGTRRVHWRFQPTGVAFADPLTVRGPDRMYRIDVDVLTGIAHVAAR